MDFKKLWQKHYGKVVAFFSGWFVEAQMDLTGWLNAAKALLGLN